MIPCIATVRVRTRQNRAFRLWIPLGLVWLLLLPVVVLLLPVVFIACLAGRVDPFQACAVVWQVLGSLNGTDVEVAGEGASLTVHLF
jgi:uncharacterized membrane protein